MMRRYTLYTLLFILAFSAASCVDDWFERPESIGEGKEYSIRHSGFPSHGFRAYAEHKSSGKCD